MIREIRWLLAPKPAGHATLASWLNDVSRSYGFSNRADFLSEEGVQYQSSRDLYYEPSLPLLDLIARRSTLTSQAVREMTLLCMNDIREEDFKKPVRQIGVINQASCNDEIAQLDALMKCGATIPLDREYFSLDDIILDFHRVRAEKKYNFTFHVECIPPRVRTRELVDFAYDVTNLGCGLHFLRNKIRIDNKASYLCLKFAFLYSLYCSTSETIKCDIEG